MAEYHLLTTWRIEAPLEEVYVAIRNSPRWPVWWPAVQQVKQVATGDADDINSVWRYSWQGQLPYRVVFDVCATRIENFVAIEGATQGDLEGIGRWDFSHQDAVSIVRCEWHVHSTRWWMNLIAPVVRSMFIRNHVLVMQQGGEGLARLLQAPLVSQETIDLMAESCPKIGCLRKHGQIKLVWVLIVGFGAGVIATVAQLVMWRLTATPLPETFLRDARLTVAMVMGKGILSPPMTAQWDILLDATLIHFALSIAYAAIFFHLAGRLRTGLFLLAGALYGLAIYVINMYGFTMIFPWFVVARDWVTLLAHLVFGISLAGGFRLTTPCGIRLNFLR